MDYNNQESKQKMKLYDKISFRIKKAMEMSNTTQASIIEEAQKRKYNLRQSSLSKMLSSSPSSMSLANILEVAQILNLDLNKLFSTENIDTIDSKDFFLDNTNFVSDYNQKQYRSCITEYYTYYFASNNSDDDIAHGKLKLKPSTDGKKCFATFSMYNSLQNYNVCKKYNGSLIISPQTRTAYCSLINNEAAEIIDIVFRFDSSDKTTGQLALVLSSNCIDNRPTVFRMLLSKKILDPETLKILRGQLYLNESEILISEMGLNAFYKDARLNDSFKNVFYKDSNTKLTGLSAVSYYHFDESMIREAYLEPEEKLQAINLIRQYSSTPKYNKISSKSDELIQKFLSQAAN